MGDYLSVHSFFISALTSIVLFFLINGLGEFGLTKSYRTHFSYNYSEVGVFNVGYRILAPAVLLSIFALLIWFCDSSFPINQLFLSILIYWAIRVIAWFSSYQRVQTNIWFVLVQAAISIGITAYIFFQCFQGDPGSLLPQPSDISIEFAIIALLVVFQMIVQSPLLRNKNAALSRREYLEKSLYEIKNLSSTSLSERFKEDIALRVFFYSIALLEDYYRPRSFRRLEYIGHKLHLCKTTGIMQVRSDKPLTDKESIEASFEIIEKIWDEYLLMSPALSVPLRMGDYRHSVTKPCILVYGADCYFYNLDEMMNALRKDMPALYGKYRGSSLIDTTAAFNAAEKFARSQCYETVSRRVSVRHRLLPSNITSTQETSFCRVGSKEGYVRVGVAPVRVKWYSVPISGAACLDDFYSPSILASSFRPIVVLIKPTKIIIAIEDNEESLSALKKSCLGDGITEELGMIDSFRADEYLANPSCIYVSGSMF